MLQFQRKEAIELLSFVQVFQLPPEERRSKTDDALVEEDLSEPPEEVGNLYLRKYLQAELERSTNDYLERSLNSAGYAVSIFDVEPFLHSCPCCEFETLENTGQYFICPVCFWEDDGSTRAEPQRYSRVNKMTLCEAWTKFQEIGAVNDEFLPRLYVDRCSRYRKKAKE